MILSPVVDYGFASTTLADVDQGWLGRKRFDRKYFLRADHLDLLLGNKPDDYLILEIAEKKSFEYQTEYLDTPDLLCYRDHAQGKQRRAKVRIRTYLDSGLSRLEVKLRLGNWQSLKVAAEGVKTFSNAQFSFVEDALQSHFSQSELLGRVSDLQTTSLNTFTRCTLLSNSGLERITIDSAISTLISDRRFSLAPELFLVEVKSLKRNSQVASELLKHGHRAIRFSKYCAGLDMIQPDRPLVHRRSFLRSNFHEN
ncbi:MAG: polyphosphate polymerase domain-containing protein [Actinomycetales bacterium]|nr:polyphosphate polymerase domain-containing protein [Actinomycetales bacterium]